MPAVCIYFQVHQPHRLRRYSVFDTAPDYFNHDQNAQILRKVARKSYLPTTQLLLSLIERHEGQFKVAFSLTGEVIEQIERFAPEVIQTFVKLAQTGCVEFLAETYHHSLASLYNLDEFEQQVDLHSQRIDDLFHQKPAVFRNTELIYDNRLADHLQKQGRFVGVLAEGVDTILADRSPGHVYRSTAGLPLLLKHHRLSDDIAFRFADRNAPRYPLTPAKFANALAEPTNASADVINLFMDFETFGEHQWQDTGIFSFLEKMPTAVLEQGHSFITPQEAYDLFQPVDTYDCPQPTSWADTERDISAWAGNAMQTSALKELYSLRDDILATVQTHQHDHPEPAQRILKDWRRLTCSDHFYYMCTKFFEDGDVHQYFSPYESPYDSYINYMNVLDNLRLRCKQFEDALPA
jgi:alpha-amylase